MNYPQIIGAAAFIAIFGGAMLGVWLAPRLPAHHTSDNTRHSVSLATAVVGTMSALVLGFLISTANNAFTARVNAISDLAVDIIRLDDLLEEYGPIANPIRLALLQYAEAKNRELIVNAPGRPAREPLRMIDAIATSLYGLRPSDDRQAKILSDADRAMHGITDAKWLLVEARNAVVPLPLLGMLGMWLAVLFASIGLFAPRNSTSVVALFLCSLAVSGGIYMILDLGAPALGLLQPSLQPLQQAIQELSEP